MAVFSGTLTMASGPTTSGDRQTMSYDVKVDRVYKGDINSPRVTVKSDASEAACGLTGMTADTRYLFFVRVSDADLFANSCGGTGPAKSARTQKIVALLGPGSTPNPPTPEEATFTPVADAEPAHADPAGRARRRDGARRPARPDGVRCPGPLTRRQDLEVHAARARTGLGVALRGLPVGTRLTRLARRDLDPGGSARRICSNCARAAICWA